MFGPRMTLVENAAKIKTSSSFKKNLAEAAKGAPSADYLIAVFRGGKALADWSVEGAKSEVFATLKAWDDGGVKDRALAEAKLLGLTLEPTVPYTLFRLLGVDPGKLYTELTKFKGLGVTKVTDELVRKYVAPTQVPTVFDAVEDALQGDCKTALHKFQVTYKAEGQVAVVPLAIGMQQALGKVHEVHLCQEAGLGLDSMVQAMGVPKFILQKSMSQASRLSKASVLEKMKIACKLEVYAKSVASPLEKRVASELALLELGKNTSG